MQHVAGVAGGMFAARKKILAGSMFGALAAVLLLNIATNRATAYAPFAGSMTLHYLKIPAGVIIGSMLATILLNLTLGASALPDSAKKAVQIYV